MFGLDLGMIFGGLGAVIAAVFGLLYKSKSSEVKAEKRRADNLAAANTQNKAEMDKQHDIQKAKDDALSVDDNTLDERMRKYDRAGNSDAD